MRVAVLGGGLQGCCTAVELAIRGARVTLYDRNAALLAGAATANEGKIHLGYVYASDRSFATARMMLRGALAFAPLMQRYLEADVSLAASDRFLYAVHRDSQVGVADFAAYLGATHDLVASAPDNARYFGIDLTAAPRRLTRAELGRQFDPAVVSAAFDTAEIAIDPVAMAGSMRQRITQDPAIDVRTDRTITAVKDGDAGLQVHSVGRDHNDADACIYDSVVNALWDGRLAIDATRGLHPGRRWIYRFKHGVRFRLVGAAELPSVTVVLGPFGDLVSYGGDSFYVSWYPACMTARSSDLTPPVWPSKPDDPCGSPVLTESLAGMATIIPGLQHARPSDITVKGGVIVAWGSTDIDDRGSELHRRHEIGVQSHGRYHSIETGKLTMAPCFAMECADRVLSMRLA